MRLRFRVEAPDGPGVLAAAQAQLDAFADGLTARLVEVNALEWVTGPDGAIKAWCADCEAIVEDGL